MLLGYHKSILCRLQGRIDLGGADAGDVWEIMGMEHDVTGNPGSWIWARWRGFEPRLAIWAIWGNSR